MNTLIIGKNKVNDIVTYAYDIKKQLNLENFNVFLACLEADSYETFISKDNVVDYIYYENESFESKKIPLKEVLKGNKYGQILIDEDVNDINVLADYIKKYSRANHFYSLQSIQNINKKTSYKMIPIGTAYQNAINQNLNDEEIKTILSLTLLNTIYHIDLSSYDDKVSNIAILACLNPYNSPLFNKKIAFIGKEIIDGIDHYSFADKLYLKHRYAYLKDTSDKSNLEKVKEFALPYDVVILQKDDSTNEALSYIKENLDCQTILISNTMDDEVLTSFIEEKLLKGENYYDSSN